jgi:hypothetical protein
MQLAKKPLYMVILSLKHVIGSDVCTALLVGFPSWQGEKTHMQDKIL